MFNLSKNQWTILDLSTGDTNLLVWIEAFLIDRKVQNLSPGTISFYQKKLKLFLDFCESQVITQIKEITPDVIRRYLFYLEEKGHNPGGIHAAYRAIKAFLNWWENEFEPENWKNPIRKVKAPRVPIEPIEGVQSEDFQKLIGVCERKTFYGERSLAILFTLLDTGIRASELVDLDVSDFDFIAGSVLIRQGKGRKPRTVFTGRRTRKQIRSWIRKRGANPGALFTTKSGDKLTYWGLREIIKSLSDKAGIPSPGLHDFRRSFALESLRNGVDLQTIARLMGHTSLQVLTRYLRQTNEDLNTAYKSPVDDLTNL